TCLSAHAGGTTVAGPAAAPGPGSGEGGIGRLLGVLVEPPAASAGPLGLVHGPVRVGEQGWQVPARPAFRDSPADGERDRTPVAAGDAGGRAGQPGRDLDRPPASPAATGVRSRSPSAWESRNAGRAG